MQRKRGLLTNDDVETCKGGMNTWGYVGDLNDHPQLSCVYQSDDAQNEFLSNPKVHIYVKYYFLCYCCPVVFLCVSFDDNILKPTVLRLPPFIGKHSRFF